MASRTELEQAALGVLAAMRDPGVDIEAMAADPKVASKLRQTQETLNAGLSERFMEVKGQLVDGNAVVTYGMSGGVHTGVLDMLGLAFEPTGRPVSGHVVVHLAFDEDMKVIEYRKMWDMRKVLFMMGAEFVLPASNGDAEQRIAVVDGRPARVQ
jgi:hypothetical protein